MVSLPKLVKGAMLVAKLAGECDAPAHLPPQSRAESVAAARGSIVIVRVPKVLQPPLETRSRPVVRDCNIGSQAARPF